MKPHDSSHFDESRLRVDPQPPAATTSAHLDLPRSLPHSTDAARRINEGLLFLCEAKQYADDVGYDSWDFALELRELRSLGLSNSDLRWLVLKGYIEHARETTLPGEETRTFRATRGLTFTKRTCFVITPVGVEIVTSGGVREGGTSRIVDERAEPTIKRPTNRVVPHWDGDLQELRVNGLVVKQFKVPAPNQEMVLSAFEEEQWPARIDDPLPPQAEQDPKRRLHDTIISLNRSHKHRMIRFMGDGSGEGVRWTRVTDERLPTSEE